MDTSNPLRFLPAELRQAAAKLPPGQQHTVLTLPDEGDGHNAGLIRLASICYRMGVSLEDTVAHLENVYSDDRVDHRTAPRRAAMRIWEGEGELVEREGEDGTALPDMQDELLLRFRRTPASGLLDATPHKTNLKPLAILSKMFAPEDIINIQFTGFESGTLCKMANLAGEFGDELHNYKFLNPSIFKKVEGVPNPKDGNKLATRCNANVKTRRFMLLEMDSKDEATVERFNTFALELAKFAPLILAVDTGGKSVHFWFDTSEATPKEISTTFTLACLHGADKRMGVASQIARMPNVSASDEGRGAQRVLYFDPDHTATPEGMKWNVAGFEAFIQKASQLDFYYHASNSRYYAQSNSEAWIALGRQSLNNQLAKRGFRPLKMEGEALSPVDDIISSIEMDKSIEEALKGASGRHAGYYEENGFRFLVLKSPNFIKPRKGEWRVIAAFLTWMFSLDGSGIQYQIFLGWLSASAKDLRNGGKRRALFSPAQFLHIIGQPNAGKTLLLKFILPLVLGGRSADCDELFSDKGAAFNSDMFQSELLYLDDTDVLQTDHKFRAKLGERIKSYTVGAGGSYHQKFGDKVPIAPWWRFVRMMNEEPTTLATLPPLEDGVADKVIILRARSMEGGQIDTSKPGWFEPVRDAIARELPAFIHYLLEEHTITPAVVDPLKRYAVKSYHDPSILELLSEDSPESYLVQKIDTEANGRMFLGNAFDEEEKGGVLHPWEGTANELYSILSEVGTRNAQDRFRKTCPSPKVLASQLRAAAKDCPRRFAYSATCEEITPKKKNGYYFWRILPPMWIPGARVNVKDEDCF
jgi:hypothetical protein